jgi:hypothetical protein
MNGTRTLIAALLAALIIAASSCTPIRPTPTCPPKGPQSRAPICTHRNDSKDGPADASEW